MEPALARLEQAVVAGARYGMRVAMAVETAGERPPAVLAVRFLDAKGVLLKGPAKGLLPSPKFGLYRYLGRAGQTGDMVERVVIVPPAGAARARVAIYSWQGARLRLQTTPILSLLPLGGQNAQQASSISYRILAAAEASVTPDSGAVVRVRFSQPVEPDVRAALATVQVFDADGSVLPLGDEVPVSEAVGPFRYLRSENPQDGDTHWGTFGLVLPPQAHHLAVQILRWDTETPLRVEEIQIAPSGGPVLAQGETDVTDIARVRFAARLQPHRGAPGAPMALLELQALDAYGRALKDPVPGTRRTEALWPNIRWRQPPSQDKAHLGRILDMPRGAARLRWRLRSDAELSEQDVSLDGSAQMSPVEETAWDHLLALPWATDPPHRRFDLPDAPFNAAIAGQITLLGAARAPANAGWLRVTGRATGRVRIWPWLRQAQQGWQAPPALGLIPGPDSAWVAETQSTDADGGFEATLLLPEGTVEILVVALAPTGAARALRDVALTQIRPDDVVLVRDPSALSVAGQAAALPLAQCLGDLPTEAMLRRALAADEDAPGGQRAAARRLRAELSLIDGHWTPDPAPATLTPRDAESVLCLAPAPPQDPGQRRLRALMQARPGPCHWGMPWTDGSDDTRPGDGNYRVRDGAIHVHQPHFAALNPAHMLATDRLNLMVRLWQRLLVQTGAGLVHATDGPNGTDLALVGLALARAHDLPFVYDRTGFTAHLWRAQTPARAALQSTVQTRLRLAQEARLMAAADMMLAPSAAFGARLQQRGVPEGKIAVVPQAASDLALDRGAAYVPPDALTTLPHKATRVAVICGAGRPGAARIATEARSQHPNRDQLHLVLLDATETPDPVNATATGPLDDAARCAWLDACDLVLAPSDRDAQWDWTPPTSVLDAMARNRPVILSDSPCASELAGPQDDQSRALLVTEPGPEALLQGWLAAQADTQATLARTLRAADWVQSRTWDHAATVLTQAYSEARALHRAKGTAMS